MLNKNKKSGKIELKINLCSALCSIFIALLLSYAIIDFSYVQPNIKNHIINVNFKFDSLKVYLDNKLPELDTALSIHAKQLTRQTIQIKELTDLTQELSK